MDTETIEKAEAQIASLRECFNRLRQNVSQAVLGQEDVIAQLCAGLVCGGHMLLIGVPGLAKTMMVRVLAGTLGWEFRRIQFTPDLMPSDITGTEILQEAGGGERELIYRPGPIFTNLLLADEINRTPPKTQAALLEAMQEYGVTAGGRTYALPRPFVVVATQNPIEQEGTYPLPEAQLDRFMLSIHIDYPDYDDEVTIATRAPGFNLPSHEAVASAADFESFRRIIEHAPVSEHVARYAVALCAGSRPWRKGAQDFVNNYVGWGAGPRASQYLILAAKAAAVLEGRAAPEIADVRRMALPVLRHRVIPNYNALGEGLDSADIVNHLLKNIHEQA